MSVFRRITLAPAVAVAAGGAVAAASVALAPAAQARAQVPFISGFHKITTIASTVPGNGDVNPYGVAVIRSSNGSLHAGSVLVSNFNNAKNLQGTGTTIVQVSPGGKRTTFARITKATLPGACPGGVGLTTALVVLRGGWVVVGSLPSKGGSAATTSAGCLIVLDNHGNARETFSGNGINGPWDMSTASLGQDAALFVTNVLNGTVAAGGSVVSKGTVLRLNLSLSSRHPPALTDVTTIGSGFGERTDPNALVVGPTGVGLGPNGTLYVADSQGNRITAIAHAVSRMSSAGTGQVVTSGGALSTPLGLTLASDGDILTVNGGNGKLVETTPAGTQAATRMLDRSGSPPGAGALFGLALAPHGAGLYYVDDAVNTLRLLH
jgi:hypothetical protein